MDHFDDDLMIIDPFNEPDLGSFNEISSPLFPKRKRSTGFQLNMKMINSKVLNLHVEPKVTVEKIQTKKKLLFSSSVEYTLKVEPKGIVITRIKDDLKWLVNVLKRQFPKSSVS